MSVKSPLAELETFFAQSSLALERRILDVVGALAGDREGYARALRRLREQLAEMMTLADLFGRRRAFLELDAARRGAQFADQVYFPDGPLVPQVPFQKAIDDIVAREPRLANDWREVADLYQQRHAFALARSSSVEITQRVQKALGELSRGGATAGRAEQVIRDIGADELTEHLRPWSRGYAETVYRTNMNTAYTAGRFETAKSPLVAAEMPAFERLAVGDSSTRPWHEAANRLILATTDPGWRTAATPSGYG